MLAMQISIPFRHCKTCRLLLGLLVIPAMIRAQPTPTGGRIFLPESIRPVATAGAASPSAPTLTRTTLTAAEAVTPMHVETVLKMRHFAELQRRVASGETLSRGEMASRYLPLESDYKTVAHRVRAGRAWRGQRRVLPVAGYPLFS